MNTTLTTVLYTSKTLSDGTHPLMLRLTKNRRIKYISLHISLDAKFWDFDKNRPKRNCPDKERINTLIETKTKELQEQIAVLDRKAGRMKSVLSNGRQDADYANASEFYTELFMVREERQRYEEACKEWQQKCVEVELVAVKDSKYFGDVIPISRNRGR